MKLPSVPCSRDSRQRIGVSGMTVCRTLYNQIHVDQQSCDVVSTKGGHLPMWQELTHSIAVEYCYETTSRHMDPSMSSMSILYGDWHQKEPSKRRGQHGCPQQWSPDQPAGCRPS